MARTLLAIGAHVDDALIGVGGILLQAIRAGHRVVVVAVVSDHATWSRTRGRERQAREQLVALAREHGFEWRFLERAYHVTDAGDLSLKRELAALHRELRPDAAFIHHVDDHFPDHVAAGRCAHDALLFAHGLTDDLAMPRCPSIQAFAVTPWQTYGFSEDRFYDVGDVIAPYLDLLNSVDVAYLGEPLADMIHAEVRLPEGRSVPLGPHAFTKFADCVRHGSMAGCRYAIGLRTVWGDRNGIPLW